MYTHKHKWKTSTVNFVRVCTQRQSTSFFTENSQFSKLFRYKRIETLSTQKRNILAFGKYFFESKIKRSFQKPLKVTKRGKKFCRKCSKNHSGVNFVSWRCQGFCGRKNEPNCIRKKPKHTLPLKSYKVSKDLFKNDSNW